MAEVTYQIRKTTAVPTTPTTPNTFFYVAPTSNTTHDRDINASINILNQADKVLTLS